MFPSFHWYRPLTARLREFIWLPVALLCTAASADGPADNQLEQVRRIPPAGVPVPDSDRQELRSGVDQLGAELGLLRKALEKNPTAARLLPDLEIYHKSVDWALRYDEFFRTNEMAAARDQLREGHARVAALMGGQSPWTTNTGLIVRGYRSKVDDSVQPYGLVIPKSYSPTTSHRYRLDCWFHGRGEQLSELNFINDRSRSPGEFTPPDTFVLHLYGRYCNGSRFAGETDFWEALAATQREYPIDTDRIVVRGFSLGGAACWHITTHHASHWAAAAPGAGFSESADFLKVFQHEELHPSDWEQKLWRMYDSTSHALNTAMVPLVAYSGEIDSQRQAAQAMEKAMEAEGLVLTHLIGPKTGHSYEPVTKQELNRRIDLLAARGRVRVPSEVHFVTHTLRYNEMAWVRLEGLEQHWEQARVNAHLDAPASLITVDTTNVTSLTLDFPSGDCPFPVGKSVTVLINGQKLTTSRPGSDLSWHQTLTREGNAWRTGAAADGLHKRPGLQGPIDDAFMDSFLVVQPSGTPWNETVGNWVKTESAHALEHWRREFRGDARQRLDKEVTDADIRDHNLVLWGDPSSNALLARIADRLPIHWTQNGVTVGDKVFPSTNHALVLICPNPLNPSKYVVLNSGFTFREYDYLNNARQTSKLPDWAVLDLRTPPNARFPGAVEQAGFFNENWELK